MWPLGKGSLQVRNSVPETQLAKRRSGRPRLSLVLSMAWHGAQCSRARADPRRASGCCARAGTLRRQDSPEVRRAGVQQTQSASTKSSRANHSASLAQDRSRAGPRRSRVVVHTYNSLYLISTIPPADQPGYANRPLFTLCAASTHASTDVIRPIARCLRYGRLAPINSDAIPATKRPNAIHLGCMVNLVATLILCYYGWRRSGGMSVPPTDWPHRGSWYSTRTLPWKMSQAGKPFSRAHCRAPASVSNPPYETHAAKSMR